MPVNLLPSGFLLVGEEAGRYPFAPGMTNEVAYAAMLFDDASGGRIAVSLIATGTGETRVGLRYARDALCSKEWVNGDCDPQYNSYRYVASEPTTQVGEKIIASERAARSGAGVPSDTFVRAGLLVTLSVEAADESLFEQSPEILRALDVRVLAFAAQHGVTTD